MLSVATPGLESSATSIEAMLSLHGSLSVAGIALGTDVEVRVVAVDHQLGLLAITPSAVEQWVQPSRGPRTTKKFDNFWYLL
ncbi:MAG TPA: hypothetical protein DIC52_11565, partial [Candidatus Latescibacteria bacterium]|nr:hypothetical protein [Candidatus Latescibacterota bacterium]